MELCNLTQESVSIVDEDGKLIITYPSRGIATCTAEEKQVRTIDGVTILRKRFKPVSGLPLQAVDADKIYIVSAEVAEAVRDTRMDVVIASEKVENTEFANAYKSLTVI